VSNEARCPIPGQIHGVIEDGILHRALILSGEASYRPVEVRKAQEETQGFLKRCEVADDSVVVMKSRPEKAGNRLEEKTGMTHGLVHGDCQKPKALTVAKG